MHIEASYCNSCLVRLIRHPTVKPTLKVRSWLHTKQNLSGRSLSCENRTAFHVENRPSPPKQLCNLTFTLLPESAQRTTSATGSGVEIRELSKYCETSEMRLKTGGNFPLAKLTIAGRIEDTTMPFTDPHFFEAQILQPGEVTLEKLRRAKEIIENAEPAPTAFVSVNDEAVCDWWEANNSSLAWSGDIQGVAWDDLWPQAKEEIHYIYNSFKNEH